MYNTITNTSTSTYTVVDIRKTFEGFEADLRMIARRTGKWTQDYADKVLYDIIKLAENKYLNYVDIVLLDPNRKPMRASRYQINEDGKGINSERAGGNDWPDLPDTSLSVILSYNSKWHSLPAEEKEKFGKDVGFKISWSISEIDNSYSHLSKENAQLYASKGYELKKQNFK